MAFGGYAYLPLLYKRRGIKGVRKIQKTKCKQNLI
jgi:hypothetical protein